MLRELFLLILQNLFILLFITAGLGLLFGKIQFGKFNFGSSGALFVGLLVGWGVYTLAQDIYESGDPDAAGMSAARTIMETNGGNIINTLFFSASLIIFVATVGLLAAKDLKVIIKKYGIKFIALGFLITVVGAAGTYASTAIVKDANPFAVTGVYTGAMTSSPGLAASLEAAEDRANEMADNYAELSEGEKEIVLSVLTMDSEYAGLEAGDVQSLTEDQKTSFVNQAVSQVGIGSAVAYPFGVIIVILAVNFLNVIFKFDLNEEKSAVKTLTRALKKYNVPASLVKKGFEAGRERMQAFHQDIVERGRSILAEAEREGRHVIVLAGRPYHTDPEINHGINKLLTSLGIAVLSEDAVFEEGNLVKVNVLDQWTYHARLYRAAEFVTRHENVDLVQLVSFGCGIDAVTTDEVRSILESRGKLYTQIKIDEINNLGVVKIRLRSLLAAIEEQKAERERESA